MINKVLDRIKTKKLFLRCIELCDFMSFPQNEPDEICTEYLSQYINPAWRKGKKLSIFIGDHGSGKSVFISALLWALYGEVPNNYGRTLLSNDAIERCDYDKTIEALVSVDFWNHKSNISWVACKEYIKTQNQMEEKSQKNTIELSGGFSDFMDFHVKTKSDIHFEAYVPQELKSFMFFDGEEKFDIELWEKNNIIVSLINLWQRYRDKYVKGEKVRRKLQIVLNRTFKKICVNKKYQVELDRNFAPKIYDRKGFIDLTDVLSINEQSVLRLAYALTISKYINSMQSKVAIPLVLDNPFVKMDVGSSRKAAKIIHKYAPQIFILLSSFEIRNKVVTEFEKCCGSLFELRICNRGTEIKEYCCAKEYYSSSLIVINSNSQKSSPVKESEQKSLNSLLLRSIEKNSLKVCEEALLIGANTNCHDQFDFYALVSSIINDRYKIFKLLIRAGADPYYEDGDYNNAIMYAANEGKIRCLRYFVQNDIDINYRSSFGVTPLMTAVLANRILTSYYLLKHSADKHIENCNGRKAIDIAKYLKHSTIKILLSFFNQHDHKLVKINGFTDALYKLGYMFHEGIIFKRNIGRSIYFYQKAARRDDTGAMVNLASIYEKEEGLMNLKEAEKLYLKAAELGDPLAQDNLGMMYRDGNGVDQDYKLARELFIKSASQGHSSAMVHLGGLFFGGKGIGQNYNEAFKWYLNAAETGDKYGQFNLGIMYEKGLGTVRDYEAASKMYIRAAQQGHIKAQYNLACLYLEKQNNKKNAIQWLGIASANGLKKADELINMIKDESIHTTEGVKNDDNNWID